MCNSVQAELALNSFSSALAGAVEWLPRLALFIMLCDGIIPSEWVWKSDELGNAVKALNTQVMAGEWKTKIIRDQDTRTCWLQWDIEQKSMKKEQKMGKTVRLLCAHD